MITAHQLTKQFNQLEVLKSVSFSAKQGEIVGLIGASGSGKSTLLRCLNLLEIPNQGRLEILGTHLEFDHASQNQRKFHQQYGEAIRKIRVKMPMVFQQFNLWSHLTVLDNICLAPIQVLKQKPDEVSRLGLSILEKVGIADKANSYPNALSGGQQQRVAIARALAMKPEAILFDEPTSALDPVLVSEVLSTIELLAREGKTMLIVTHEMSFVEQICDRVLFLYEGEILEEGAPKTLFKSPQTDALAHFLKSYNNA